MGKANIFVVGLMGGIASGKSTVAKMFEKFGAKVIDADELVHKALADPDVQHKILELWGKNLMVLEHIDKRALAKIVFSSKENLEKLESIIHPIVKRNIQRRLENFANSGEKLAVLDVALLLESGLNSICDTLIFVDTPVELRQKRASQNRGWAFEEIITREKFQASIEDKKKVANYIIQNHGDMDEIFSQVQKIWINLTTK